MNVRDQILAASDIESQALYMAEWGVTVVVRSMTGLERERFERDYEAAKEAGQVRALMAALCCYDQDGNKLFTLDDVPALATKSTAALGRIFDEAIKLSAISKDDVEALEGN